MEVFKILGVYFIGLLVVMSVAYGITTAILKGGDINETIRK